MPSTPFGDINLYELAALAAAQVKDHPLAAAKPYPAQEIRRMIDFNLDDIVELDMLARFGTQLHRPYVQEALPAMKGALWQVMVYDPADCYSPYAVTPLLGVQGPQGWATHLSPSSDILIRSATSPRFVPDETPLVWTQPDFITKIA